MNKLIFIPDSKTADGRRKVPTSDRAMAILSVRCTGRSEVGLPFKALTRRSPDNGRQVISTSSRESWPAERPGLVLQSTRLWNTGAAGNWKSGSRDEDNGTQG